MEGYGRSTTDKCNRNKEKEPWMSYCHVGEGAPHSGLIGGFSWPPRSYICTFCKREFRSAQALGGHMNVHRRDKARLRQCSPPLDPPVINPNPNRNPNLESKPCAYPIPNLNMPPPSVLAGERIFPAAYTFPFMLSPHQTHFSSSSRGGHDMKITGALKPLSGVAELKDLFEEGTRNGLRKGILKLDLEIGKFEDEEKNLDLELRLGYM